MQKIIIKIVNYLKILFLIIFLIIFIDLFINILLPETFKKRIGITRNYSLKSNLFHHEIAHNINEIEENLIKMLVLLHFKANNLLFLRVFF